jgi:hypothetical protein
MQHGAYNAESLQRIDVIWIQFQSAAQVLLGLGELPVVEQPDHRNGVMRLRKPLIQAERLLRRRLGFGIRLPRRHAEEVAEQCPGAGHECIRGGISGIDGYRLFETLDRLALPLGSPSIAVITSERVQPVRLGLRTILSAGYRLAEQRLREAGRQFIFERKQIRAADVERVGPEMLPVADADQPGIEAEPVARALNAGVEHRLHPEL